MAPKTKKLSGSPTSQRTNCATLGIEPLALGCKSSHLIHTQFPKLYLWFLYAAVGVLSPILLSIFLLYGYVLRHLPICLETRKPPATEATLFWPRVAELIHFGLCRQWLQFQHWSYRLATVHEACRLLAGDWALMLEWQVLLLINWVSPRSWSSFYLLPLNLNLCYVCLSCLTSQSKALDFKAERLL